MNLVRDMKRWMCMLLACGALLAGCSDEDNQGPVIGPKTLEAFEKQFPDAQNVRWAKKQGYDVAYFTLAASRAAAGQNTAWYPEGSARCTFTKIEISWAQLEQEAPAVAAAWNASSYKTEGYLLDDIDRRTYDDAEPTYKLEIELRDAERELIYDRSGTLLADRPDLDSDDDEEEDDPCPQPIYDFITINLPDALIVETDREHEDGAVYYEVEVLLNGTEQDLIFDSAFKFLFIVVEVDERQYDTALPKAVYDKFLELAPDRGEWDDVTIRKQLDGTVIAYTLTVEDDATDRETTYMVSPDGTLVP